VKKRKEKKKREREKRKRKGAAIPQRHRVFNSINRDDQSATAWLQPRAASENP